MDQFSRWSGIAHAHITQHYPTVKLGQVHQLLAAALGHSTYASLRALDLDALHRRPRYVLFEVEAALARAQDLGLRIEPEHWQQACLELTPSGITPFWLTSKEGMERAAGLTFEVSEDERVEATRPATDFPDGRRTLSVRCLSEGEVPDSLRFEVIGEVLSFSDSESLATPVTAIVEFPKVGRRMYDTGVIVSVEQSGSRYARSDDDYLPDYSDEWVPED